jgi:NhaP-type Na+/H+ or K+/H+ antiporter
MRLRDVLALVLVAAAIAVLDHFGSNQTWGISVAVGVVAAAGAAVGVAIRRGSRNRSGS